MVQALGGLVAPMATIVVAALGFIQARRAASIGHANHLALEENKTLVGELAKQMNGVKTELVYVTGEAARAKGNLEGRAELKTEQKEEAVP